MKARTALVSMVLVLALAGCNDGNNSTSPSTVQVSQAQIALSTVPAVIVRVVPSSDPSYQWQLSFSAVLQESAGLGANVNFIELTFPSVGVVQ